jgi:hypothetical protein
MNDLPLLHAAWILQLQSEHWILNGMYAGRRLKLPLFRIGRHSTRLGEWDPLTRTITIAETHILSNPWTDVIATLKHEMAHQFVSEVMGIPDAAPHGAEFQKACAIFRVHARASARPGELGSIDESEAERDRMLARVRDLLRLATSPNEHEAASAMRMAHKYLLKYNLDLAQLDRRLSYETRYLGKVAQRVQEWEYILANILQEHFFVQVIHYSSYDALAVKEGTVLEVIGTRENLDGAEYAYHFVRNNAERLWLDHRRAHPGMGGSKLQYLAGLLRGFQRKLAEEKKGFEEERGLVWKGDPGLDEHVRHLHPRLRRISCGGVSRGDSFRAGEQDGRKMTIHRGVEERSENRGRLLPGT